ncbi:DedA family protein [Streptomyces hilarionis]|uniref:DedA family protein n=1 Tax=Streptomyces hilarionis TaxID=2839954 RepID=UPI00211A6C13|nr:DedA family protein [Streptomyces hilarionis]MCQ9133739.1 DedA family protein [Streptomyces hilarionis]
MNAVCDLLDRLPPVAVYAVVATAVLAESLLLVGAVIPTLTLLLTAGALARTGHVSLPPIIAVAVGAVVTGDFLAHRTGRFLADRLRTGRAGRRVPLAVWARAETLMARHGGRAVLLARFLPVIRTLAPHCAGAARLPYRRIAPYSAVAACVWATAETSVGYAAASSLQRALTLAGPAAAVLVLSATAVALAVRRSVPRRGEKAA